MIHSNKAVARGAPDAAFGRGSEDIVRVNWGCTGNETKLADCLRNATMCLGPDIRNSAGLHCFGN